MDLVNVASPQVPAYGSQQDNIFRDASLISPPVGANGIAVGQEGDQSQVEGESSTENQLSIEGEFPSSSTWNQIPVQGDSFLNDGKGSVTGGSSSTGS